MANNITSADAIMTLTISDLWGAPITLENWASDRGWDVGELEMAETQMSIDGKLNRGWVPRAITQTITFSAASASIIYLELLMTSQTQSRSLYTIGGELTLKSTGRKYTFTDGCLLTGSVAPNGGTVLENRTFSIQWGEVLPAGI